MEEDPDEVVAHVGLEHSPGRKGARAARDDDLADLELLGQPCRVHRAGAAERDERVLTRVDPLLDGDRSHRVGHARVDHLQDALGKGGVLDAELARQRRERALRGVLVELHLPAEEVGRVEPSQKEVCVGDGRLRATAAVASGTRVGSSALWSHAQAASLEPGERAAACADRVDVD